MSLLTNSINMLLRIMGYDLVPKKQSYISAKETIDNARKMNLSVCDYIELIWDQKGATQKVIDNMVRFGALHSNIKTVCEIGAGTGRYMEKVKSVCHPSVYDSYEVAEDWAEWLAKEYGVVSRKTDGKSLSFTNSSSVDLVHAHGVFVYLPFLTAYRYFMEMSRVVKPGGYVVFDCFSEKVLDEKSILKWLESGNEYPCFISEQYIKDFFLRNRFKFVGEFFNKYGAGQSYYFVFQKEVQ